MRLRTLSTLLSDVLSHLPGAEYERAKCEALAAQVQEQRAHVENLVLRLEHMTKQRDQAEERETEVAKDAEARLNAVWHHIGEKKTLTDERDAAREANARLRTQLHGQADALLSAQSDLAAAEEERDAEKVYHEGTARDRHARIAERNEARAQYEAEKAAHGETQRHLVTAIAERDGAMTAMKMADAVRLAAHEDHDRKVAAAEESAEHWRGFAVERLNLLADMERERDALRARVAELQSGEAVAWICAYEGGPTHLAGNSLLRDVHHSQGAKIKPLFRSQPAAPVASGEPVAWLFEFANGRRCYDSFKEHAEAAAKNPDVTRVTPLYAAPQPPALGVIDHGWGVLVGLSHEREFVYREHTNVLTSEADACSLARAFQDKHAEVVRIVPANTTVVDVERLRALAKTVLGGDSVRHVSAEILAAIGKEH